MLLHEWEQVVVILLYLIGISKSCTISKSNNYIAYPAGIYLFKVNNGNTRAMCKICSKIAIKTPGRHRNLFKINNKDTRTKSMTFLENQFLCVQKWSTLWKSACIRAWPRNIIVADRKYLFTNQSLQISFLSCLTFFHGTSPSRVKTPGMIISSTSSTNKDTSA